MLAGNFSERHATITPSREGEGVMVACPVHLCVVHVTLGERVCCQALTAFCTSRARRS